MMKRKAQAPVDTYHASYSLAAGHEKPLRPLRPLLVIQPSGLLPSLLLTQPQ